MEKLGGVKIRKIYEIDETDKNYPQALLQIKNNPKKIYAMGNIKLLQNKALAIVGTRDNTTYGEEYTKRIAKKISQAGITVVSGLAIGIDSIAHRYSMQNKGRTIAVIGSGFHHIYPEENKELFNEILQNKGCIVSEYSPNERVKMSHFPTRNRIIAGLSKGVLVIEAKYRSGSSITARYAFEQQKPAFCLPNQVGIKTGVGTNNLIKTGAKLITNINEILFEIGEEQIIEQDVEEENNKTIKVEKEYAALYQMLKKGPMTNNELAKDLKESIVEINQKLTIMEIEGLIETLPGNKVKRKEKDVL